MSPKRTFSAFRGSAALCFRDFPSRVSPYTYSVVFLVGGGYKYTRIIITHKKERNVWFTLPLSTHNNAELTWVRQDFHQEFWAKQYLDPPIRYLWNYWIFHDIVLVVEQKEYKASAVYQLDDGRENSGRPLSIRYYILFVSLSPVATHV